MAGRENRRNIIRMITCLVGLSSDEMLGAYSGVLFYHKSITFHDLLPFFALDGVSLPWESEQLDAFSEIVVAAVQHTAVGIGLWPLWSCGCIHLTFMNLLSVLDCHMLMWKYFKSFCFSLPHPLISIVCDLECRLKKFQISLERKPKGS